MIGTKFILHICSILWPSSDCAIVQAALQSNHSCNCIACSQVNEIESLSTERNRAFFVHPCASHTISLSNTGDNENASLLISVPQDKDMGLWILIRLL